MSARSCGPRAPDRSRSRPPRRAQRSSVSARPARFRYASPRRLQTPLRRCAASIKPGRAPPGAYATVRVSRSNQSINQSRVSALQSRHVAVGQRMSRPPSALKFETEKTFPPPRIAKTGTLSLRKSHHKSQCDVETRDVFHAKPSNAASNSLAPNRHRFVGNHLRSHLQSIFSARLDRYAKIGSFHELGCHLANHHRRVMRGKGIGLYDNRGARLPAITCRRDDHDLTASHRDSIRRPPRSISAHPAPHLGPKPPPASPRVAVPILTLHRARRAATRARHAGVAAHAWPSFVLPVTPLRSSTAAWQGASSRVTATLANPIVRRQRCALFQDHGRTAVDRTTRQGDFRISSPIALASSCRIQLAPAWSIVCRGRAVTSPGSRRMNTI